MLDRYVRRAASTPPTAAAPGCLILAALQREQATVPDGLLFEIFVVSSQVALWRFANVRWCQLFHEAELPTVWGPDCLAL
jgi:hypothetical protein